MKTRREFLTYSTALGMGCLLAPSLFKNTKKVKNAGIQLYTFRKEMSADAMGTLKLISGLGIKQIESAGSEKGNYYGLKPKEMKQACADLGMTLRSNHVHIDDKWTQTLNEAAEAGQDYIICSSMPDHSPTLDNFKKTADLFNKCGEDARKLNLNFGYHNHNFEFAEDNGQVLYDVLLKNTDAKLVHMELDLGWVFAAGKDPLEYFENYKGRFPLWHLKDMDLQTKQSTEFGKGGLPIVEILRHSEESGMKYFFVEQEDYAVSPLESMKVDMAYLESLDY